jgi:hypothetical protein
MTARLPLREGKRRFALLSLKHFVADPTTTPRDNLGNEPFRHAQ